MKQLLPLLLLVLSSQTLFSQKWLDLNGFTPNNLVTITDYTSDDKGNHYYCGTYRGQYILGKDTITSTGFSNNGFIFKADKNQEVQWAVGLDCSSLSQLVSLAVDDSGNVVASGSWFGDLTVNSTKYTASGYDGMVVHFDSTGKFNWIKVATGTSTQQGYAVAIDDDGYVYWTGQTIGSATIAGRSISPTQYAVYTAKINSGGNTVRVRSHICSSVIIPNLCEVKGDVLVLGGSFFGSITIGSSGLTSAGSYDCFIIKYDTSMTVDWARRYGNTGLDQLYEAYISSNGNIAIGGTFTTSINFGSTSISGGTNEIFVALMNSNAGVLMAKTLPATNFSQQIIRGIHLDENDNVTFSGSFSNTVTWDKKNISSSGNLDVFAASYTRRGAPLWFIKGGGNSIDQSLGLYANGDNTFTVGGSLIPRADFGDYNITGTFARVPFNALIQPPITPPKFSNINKQYIYKDSTYTRNIALTLDYKPQYKLHKGPSDNFTFNANTGQIAFTPDSSQLGNHTIKISATNGGGSDTLEFVIEAIRIPKIDFTFPANACLNQEVMLSFDDMNFGPISIEWSLGDSTFSTDASPLKTYSDTGTYLVTLEIMNVFLARDSSAKTIRVNSIPNIGFSVQNSCINDTLKMESSSSIDVGSVNQFKWFINDTLAGANSNYQQYFSQKDSFEVRLQATSDMNCSNEYVQSVTISGKPTAFFIPLPSCSGEPTLILDQSKGDGDAIEFYEWNFGDGTTLTSTSSGTSHNYKTSGSFTISMTVVTGNNCEASYSTKINVVAKPKAQFSITDVCFGETVVLNDVSTSSQGQINNRRWLTGDGKAFTQKTVNYKYANPGTYKVMLIVSTNLGCIDTAEHTLLVSPGAESNFDLIDSCFRTVNQINYTGKANSKDPITTYDWWINNQKLADNQASTNYTFDEADKKYGVKLLVTTQLGCKDSLEKELSLLEVVPAQFSVDATCISSASPLQESFDRDLLDSIHWIGWGVKMIEKDTKWEVLFSEAVKHQLYIATYATNGCKDSQYVVLTANELPNSAFDIDSTNQPRFTFSAIEKGLTEYFWEFGNNTTSFEGDEVTHTYEAQDQFTVTLNVTDANGCTSSSSRIVNTYIISFDENQLASLDVFPNPFEDKIYIKTKDFDSNNMNLNYDLYTVLGKRMLSGQLENSLQGISTAHLPSGSYILKIHSKTSQQVISVIKQ